MRRVAASAATPETFAPFGRLIDLTREAPGEVIATLGPDWADHRTRDPLLQESPSLGRTVGSAMQDPVGLMERHERAGEAILPAGAPVVLTVAEPTVGSRPRAEAVRAFVVSPGTVAVMESGVWHAECSGVDGPVPYFWLASCENAGSSPWTPIEGGPVQVVLDAPTEGGDR